LLLLLAVAIVDQRAPTDAAPVWRRLAWLTVEIALCALVVRTQGTLIRPALIHLLPVGRAILLFGPRGGLLVSVLVWLAYGFNIAPGAWPDHLSDYANYFSVAGVTGSACGCGKVGDRHRAPPRGICWRGASQSVA
jgi:hypothetical protein